MNKSSHFLLATALSTVMGLTALIPGAYAQAAPAAPDAPAVAQPDNSGGIGPKGGPRGEKHGGMHLGGIAGMICSTDGATRLETRLGDIAGKLALTAEQQPLFDAYRSAALTAQTSFAESCPTVQPAATGTQPTPPDALTALKDRQTRLAAETAALNAVLPSFEALYTSLTDTQKAAFMPLAGPHHGPRGDDRGDRAGRGGEHDHGRGGDDRGGRGRDGHRG